MRSDPTDLGILRACSENGSSGGGGGDDPFTGRAAIGYDHGYDADVFYLGLALDEKCVEGFVEGCLERIGEDDPEDEQFFRDLWSDETQQEVEMESSRRTLRGQEGEACGALRDRLTEIGGVYLWEGGKGNPPEVDPNL